ncbi:hypothetical protein [Paenibacillus terrae]|uniref:Uncharacterized protein n=1 Tax=Paenibacillus terrae TaxID=159743 RepID=A0A0D7WWF4_9BACL|nr:hypothetical protein [Paenibacillus terrae]KJD43289.1 hypothetical protein QD47_23300 [Paenibacillus terrae]
MKRTLTLSDAIKESIYLLSTFDTVGHANYDLLYGKDTGSPEEQKEMVRKEMRLVRAFIRKYARLLTKKQGNSWYRSSKSSGKHQRNKTYEQKEAVKLSKNGSPLTSG